MTSNSGKKLHRMRYVIVYVLLMTMGLAGGCKGFIIKVNQKGGTTTNPALKNGRRKATPDAMLHTFMDRLDGSKLNGKEKDVADDVLQSFLSQDFRSTLRSDLRDVRDSIITYARQQDSYDTAADSKLNQLQTQNNQCTLVRSPDEMNSYFQVFNVNESLAAMLEATLMARLSSIGGVKIDSSSPSAGTMKNLAGIYQAFSLSELGVVISGSSSVTRDDSAGTVTMTGDVRWMINKDPGGLDSGLQPDPYDTADAAGNYLMTNIVFTYVNNVSGASAGTKTLQITVSVQKAIYDAKNGSLTIPTTADPSSSGLSLSLRRSLAATSDANNLYVVDASIVTGSNLSSSNPDYTYQHRMKWIEQSPSMYEFIEWEMDDTIPLVDVTLDVANLQACAVNPNITPSGAADSDPRS